NVELSAQEALNWGLVNRIVPDKHLAMQAEALAVQLSVGATRALTASKRLLYRGLTETLETQMECETQSIADMARTSDAQEAIAAFLERRTPELKGK
ncbi:enoyl-CoA hydratase-related protein, partial [Chloroflexota bacterium]